MPNMEQTFCRRVHQGRIIELLTLLIWDGSNVTLDNICVSSISLSALGADPDGYLPNLV